MNRTSLLCGNRNGQHGTQNVKTQNRATLKKREETQIPPKKPGLNSGAREGQAVPASYKTPTVLLI